jgi:hypothetical protein
MKVNSMMVVMATAIACGASGCCWLGCGPCKDEGAKCCEKKQSGIGINANVGDASAGAGVSTRGVHAEAKVGK